MTAIAYTALGIFLFVIACVWWLGGKSWTAIMKMRGKGCELDR